MSFPSSPQSLPVTLSLSRSFSHMFLWQFCLKKKIIKDVGWFSTLLKMKRGINKLKGRKKKQTRTRGWDEKREKMNGRQRTRERNYFLSLLQSVCVCVWLYCCCHYDLGGDVRKLLFKWRWGRITLSDVDECVSRSGAPLSFSLTIVLSLLFFQWVFVSHPDEVMVRDMFLSPILMPRAWGRFRFLVGDRYGNECLWHQIGSDLVQLGCVPGQRERVSSRQSRATWWLHHLQECHVRRARNSPRRGL